MKTLANIIGGTIILIILIVAIFWQPIVALFIYHDLRCAIVECRIIK